MRRGSAVIILQHWVTYLSNHTLQYINVSDASLQSLLDLNRRDNKKEVAMIKILLSHNDFDMQPFFKWEFKVLPLVIKWFERAASSVTMPNGMTNSSNSNLKFNKVWAYVCNTCGRTEWHWVGLYYMYTLITSISRTLKHQIYILKHLYLYISLSPFRTNN